MTMLRAAVLLIFVAGGWAADANAGPRHAPTAADARVSERPLRGHVYPSMAKAPATVIIEAVVAPTEENVALQFVVDSGHYYRSSTIELTGASAARVHSVEFRSVPAGAYDVRVVLTGRGGDIRATFDLQVTIVE